jgi:NDP-sugar pyrophosphorylase family protein
MDGVIFAAGLGTRLKPLTDSRPKALVEVGGVAMLERTARRLISAGVDRLVINTHAFAQQIDDFVRARDGFGVDVRISHEKDLLLETGGGLLAARRHLRGDGPFFVHNADVYTDLDLRALYAAHEAHGCLVTLATMERPSSRGLLFDDEGLCGRVNDDADGEVLVRTAVGTPRRLAFACAHVVEPRFFELLQEHGRFGIFEPYLRLAAAGEHLEAHRVDGCTWVDIGSPEQLARAEALAADERATP